MGRIEIHPRTFSQRFGETPNAQRTFIRLKVDTLSLYRQAAIADTHLLTMLVRVDLNTQR